MAREAYNADEDRVLKQMEEDQDFNRVSAAQLVKLREVEAARVDWRNKVAENVTNEQARQDAELSGIPASENYQENTSDEDEDITSDNQDTSTEPEVSPEDNEYDGSTLITKIINGKKVSRTLDDWIQLANKVEDADLYYSEAVKKLHQERTPPEPQVDIKELAKKIQLGSEEEAAEALSQVLATAKTDIRKEKSQADLQQAGKAIYQAFTNEFNDITSDPILNAALNDMDSRLMSQVFDPDPIVNFDKRLRHCGKQIRQWRDKNTSQAADALKKQELIEKKKKIVNLNTAGQKQSTSTERELSERESQQAAIARMFANRKKRILSSST
jgi:hypothetical protein